MRSPHDEKRLERDQGGMARVAGLEEKGPLGGAVGSPELDASLRRRELPHPSRGPPPFRKSKAFTRAVPPGEPSVAQSSRARCSIR